MRRFWKNETSPSTPYAWLVPVPAGVDAMRFVNMRADAAAAQDVALDAHDREVRRTATPRSGLVAGLDVDERRR